MNVINISLDTSAVNPKSASFKRISSYSVFSGQYILIVYTPRKNFPNISKDKFNVIPTNSFSKITFFIDCLLIIFKLIRDQKLSPADTVITTQDPFITGVTGYALKVIYGFKLNIQDHGNFFSAKYWRDEEPLNRFLYFIGKFLISKADTVRTVSENEKKYLISVFGLDAETVINYPVYVDIKRFFKTKPKNDVKRMYPGFRNYLLTMGRLEKQKNIPLLLDAFSDLLKIIPDSLLLIVGKGSQEENLAKLVRYSDFADNVRLIPWTDDYISYYKTSDLYVLSSDYEGTPRVIIEAMACGLPCVMTKVGSANDLVWNNVNAWVVPTRDKTALSKAMIEVITNKQKVKRITKTAYKMLKKLLSKSETINTMKTSLINTLNINE